MNMREFLDKPSQMEFWSNPVNLVQFLIIQADHHYAAASPHTSSVGEILENAASDIIELYPEIFVNEK